MHARAAAEEDPRPRQALTACAGGEATKGIAILADLYAETRNPAFVFNQGRCYQQNGQLERAADRFREYLRVGKAEPQADIQRAQGYLKEIDEGLAARRAEEARRPEAVRRSRGLRVASIALTAVSVAALATGAFLSWRVQSAEKKVEQRFAGDGVVGLPQNPQLRGELSDGGRLETWQYVSYGVGAVTLAGAVTAVVLRGAWPWAESADTATVTAAPVVSAGGLGAVVRARF
jgi:hypothetical protein